MENRAYEDEANKLAQQRLQRHAYNQHQHQHQHQPHHQQQTSQIYNPSSGYQSDLAHMSASEQRLRYGDVYGGSSEGHVYEDIVSPYGSSVAPGFHRNLTLPLRRSGPSCESLDALHSPASSSVRVTSRERTSVIDRIISADHLNRSDSGRDDSLASGGSSSSVERPQRRRRKKDCKHCKSKGPEQQQQQQLYGDRQLRPIFGLPNVAGLCHLPPGCLGPGVVYAIGCNSAECNGSLAAAAAVAANGGSGVAHVHQDGCGGGPLDDKGLITPGAQPSGRAAGMKVNSIYAQEHWHAKAAASASASIFLNDPKIHPDSPFQRAYSAVSVNSPSSDNRANLRRSVRDEPAPHPARLRKHRHGWTLHFGNPLAGGAPTACTKSLILLLIVVLALLGIGGIALYIVFEPEKLHVIQQYLRSSARNSSERNAMNFGAGQQLDGPTTGLPSSPLLLDVLLNASSPLPPPGGPPEGNDVPDDNEPVFVTAWTQPPSATLNRISITSSTTTTSTTTTTTTTTTTPRPTSRSSWTTLSSSSSSLSWSPAAESRQRRPCAECRGDEVCVARNADEAPYCQAPLDRADQSGCAGLCHPDTQSCHKLEDGAARCTDNEFCLDDEWTCTNIFCIPLVKRCDGQMNCYDHSDEYNCECNLETHFHCGNQTSCLPLSKKCDGTVDCYDASDEENCTTSHDFGRQCPSANERTCANRHQCFLKTRFCDGYKDCNDGSDEPLGCQLGRCNKHEYTCKNGRCIDKTLKCNAIDNCGDGSDEIHCRL